MRLFAAAALAVCIFSGSALAAPQIKALATPLPMATPAAPPAQANAGDSVRVAMRQQTLPPGGRLAEQRSMAERYLYVVAGQLKVSDLVTGEDQLLGPGAMAAVQPGDWHMAVAMGEQPATFYVIDRGAAGEEAAPGETASNQGN